jgi:hypothetical protein
MTNEIINTTLTDSLLNHTRIEVNKSNIPTIYNFNFSNRYINRYHIELVIDDDYNTHIHDIDNVYKNENIILNEEHIKIVISYLYSNRHLINNADFKKIINKLVLRYLYE